ncbi:phosphoribosyl-AMP cyclohydrolase [Iodidimonas gelatinilytica]|uniref:Phosphoribosyl-AMP cyclohydrolase n=1 Tax=Iodidimonas gelatinilytica TaxID=1236966 RepID=A0A5A7MUN2_9PROT|nr:phosphoribosyl-AMP cyclohydrolase [Iodidimonas gelatinilytica]GEQ99033.1 phosphoribosyl-AMP cyclohydrolase [Iodidimonas gelatinilytica]GER00783.1 phosphoribosyl-AMP cyclohydrolase [Iodidimonas gelatinilytica]
MTSLSQSISFAPPPADKTALEQGTALTPRFGPDGLIPAIATDHESGMPLMLAYMNAEALALTIKTGVAHYYSRSRQALWKKGASSGHYQDVLEIRLDCDQDAVWLRVHQHGPGACHVGHKSCFYRRVSGQDASTAQLEETAAKTYVPDDVYGKDQPS